MIYNGETTPLKPQTHELYSDMWHLHLLHSTELQGFCASVYCSIECWMSETLSMGANIQQGALIWRCACGLTVQPNKAIMKNSIKTIVRLWLWSADDLKYYSGQNRCCVLPSTWPEGAVHDAGVPSPSLRPCTLHNTAYSFFPECPFKCISY